MKKLKEIIKAGLKDMGNDALRAWGYDTKYMRAIEINAALMYGYRPK